MTEGGPGRFTRIFGSNPTHLSRAPGRVNLIGEHIDYNGLSVLPMAIDREVRLWLRPREDGLLKIANADPAFPEREFHSGPEIPPDPGGDWGNYLKAPVQELTRVFGPLEGVDCLVESTVPVASGLSSSSALVIALGLALANLNDIDVEPLTLARVMVRAERYVGTRGGGMDQTIGLLAQEGTASRIDFDPLRATPVPVPEGWSFLVADSMEVAEKSGDARREYNLRTRQCEEARAVVSAELAVEHDVDEPKDWSALLAARPEGDLLTLAQENLDSTLLARFRHVATESGRVGAAEQALRSDDAERFGGLMTDSHHSLRNDYGVSTAALNRLVEIAIGAGAQGARLTGAGFGGWALALTDPAGEADVLEAWREAFFVPRGVSGEGLSGRMFRIRPAPGASFAAL